jgi:hypothetical protein
MAEVQAQRGAAEARLGQGTRRPRLTAEEITRIVSSLRDLISGQLQRQAWQWAPVNRASDGSLPSGRSEKVGSLGVLKIRQIRRRRGWKGGT